MGDEVTKKDKYPSLPKGKVPKWGLTITMKTNFFILMLMSFITLSFSNNDTLFPSYSESMNKYPYDGCKARCFFNSCSGTSNCTCHCGFFHCDCQFKPKPKEEEGVAISMDKVQYMRTKELALFIKSLNKKETTEIYNNLSDIVTAVKENNSELFNKSRKNYLTNLNNLDKNLKNKINRYFIKVGASERI